MDENERMEMHIKQAEERILKTEEMINQLKHSIMPD